MKKLLIFIVKLYQRFISPIKPPSCRFYPSCSNYALTALERFGAIKGGYLAFKRIIRCNPLCKGGVDHVPDEFYFFRKKKN